MGADSYIVAASLTSLHNLCTVPLLWKESHLPSKVRVNCCYIPAKGPSEWCSFLRFLGHGSFFSTVSHIFPFVLESLFQFGGDRNTALLSDYMLNILKYFLKIYF